MFGQHLVDRCGTFFFSSPAGIANKEARKPVRPKLDPRQSVSLAWPAAWASWAGIRIRLSNPNLPEALSSVLTISFFFFFFLLLFLIITFSSGVHSFRTVLEDL